MPDKLAADSRDDGRVIISLTVLSAEPIHELAEYRADARKQQRGLRYDVAHTSFMAAEAHVRADRLQSEIEDMFAPLSAVPLEVLHHDRTFVKLFITLPSGAQTLPADTVKLMAARNVTLWLDT